MDNLFQIESSDEFQTALKEVVCSSSNNKTRTCGNLAIIKAASDDLRKLMIQSKFDTNKIPELLVDKCWEEERIALFLNLLNERKTELLYGYLSDQNSEYGEIVTNFNWNLKLVLGTSELNTLRYPLFQLNLSTKNNGIHKKILFDLNKEMLHEAIDVLEKLEESSK